ncbi:MAG: hypothetical protein EOO13_07060 [Chitinophagaceae bacterium]|nr:MAG: hypothetical protein EOO13_07060 [Chitinophagaceae bacterium]
MKKIFFAIGCSLFLAACNNDPKENKSTVTVDSVKVPAPVVINKDSLLVATGKSVLLALKEKDYPAFSQFFLPATAVRFSPYGFIDSTSNVELTAAEFNDLLRSGKKIVWGQQDGSGDTMLLSLPDYFKKFVYNADFLNAEKSATDKFIGSGNSLNNLKKVYPGARFIEYHFSGFDKKYGGMDWTSLRLVFKESNDQFCLIAVVHDQWTI